MIKDKKYIDLISYIKELGKIIIAFSGGVDSTFLLKVSKEVLGDNIKAVTIISPYIPKEEIEEVKKIIRELGVKHEFIDISIIEEIKNNPENRCYLCKKVMFSNIKTLAEKQGFDYVIDGTNFDDIDDYRPGIKALIDLNIKSPLLECKLTKSEIRSYSKKLGLTTWDKLPYTCLLTRIPYGNMLDIHTFSKIESAETYMKSIGFESIRVRCHGNLARIEVGKKEMSRLFNEELLNNISNKIKECGFKYVSLDIEGYRVGSLNEVIEKSLL